MLQFLSKLTVFAKVLLFGASMLALHSVWRSLFTGTVSMAAVNNASVSGIFSVAFVTVPNEETAKNLSRKLVEGKLAACVNIVPKITSIYEWDGKIHEDSELMLVIKTRSSMIDDLSAFIRQNHPYEVAEVISMKIENGNPPYLDWLGRVLPVSVHDRK